MLTMDVIAAGEPMNGERQQSQSQSARRERIGYHGYILRVLGHPRTPFEFVWRWFARPLTQPSFSRFWRYWNPAYTYLLLYWIYGPLRRLGAPRPAAVLVTFIASGFFLHDLPFNSRDGLGVPKVTILLGVFAVIVVATEALGLELSDRPVWLRVGVNLGLLGLGYGGQLAILRLVAS